MVSKIFVGSFRKGQDKPEETLAAEVNLSYPQIVISYYEQSEQN
jgi:hypothetical protein